MTPKLSDTAGRRRDGRRGVQVVADAGASITKDADIIALRRMERAGADITSTNQVLAELAGIWSSPDGRRILPAMFDLIPS